MRCIFKIESIKKLFLIVSLFSVFKTLAQTDEENKDTIGQKEWGITSAEQLADTAWWALQQKSTTDFLSLIPTLEKIKETFDSLDIKKNPQIIKIKYNTIFYKVTKQLKFLNTKAKVNKIKLKTCERDTIKIEEGKDEKGNTYAYITIKCHKGKRDFAIKFVALKLLENWYILDELKLEFPEDDPYFKIPEKSPIKIKRK
ncbi:MAG: hypothetical protein ACKVQB_10610 [Bacteroidia bacterium]